MSSFTTSGLTSGGGGLPVGMLRLTECSWIGSVMISMTRSTSITSISGVVLMSIMTSISLDDPPEPTFIAMKRSSLESAAARRRFGDEADLRDPGPLAGVDDPPDTFVIRAAVAADLHLWLRHEHG